MGKYCTYFFTNVIWLLGHKIRATKQFLNPNDCIFYKREGHTKWLGPTKFLFHSGQVLFVQHGDIFVLGSPNRLIYFNNNTGNDQSFSNENISALC